MRRDVRLLAEAGLLARFHGGVRMPGSTTENIAYRQRQRLNEGAKQRIARSVAAAVPHGCSLFVNIGTTTEAIARADAASRPARDHEQPERRGDPVDHPDCELIVAGGVVRPRDRGIIGEATVDFIRQFKVDIGLIGISGIEGRRHAARFRLPRGQVARAILDHSREVWLAADHSKFNRPAMVELARLDHLDRLYTDAPPPEPFPHLLAEAGVQCVVANCDRPSIGGCTGC